MSKTRYILFAVMLVVAVGIGFAGGRLFPTTSQASPSANIIPAQQRLVSQDILTALAQLDDGSTSFGSPQADVTIYEFSDYNCGFCKRAFREVLAAISEDGRARLVVIEFPILADSSVHAARLALHAAAKGAFAEVHTALMQWRGGISDDLLQNLADQHSLDAFALRNLEDSTIPRLQANHRIARALGIGGTPAFVIGDELIVGARSKAQFLALIADSRR